MLIELHFWLDKAPNITKGQLKTLSGSEVHHGEIFSLRGSAGGSNVTESLEDQVA